MHETNKFYVTVRLARSEKLALKTPNVLIKNGVYLWFCAIFQNDRRYGAVRYGTLENSDKNGLATVHLNGENYNNFYLFEKIFYLASFHRLSILYKLKLLLYIKNIIVFIILIINNTCYTKPSTTSTKFILYFFCWI